MAQSDKTDNSKKAPAAQHEAIGVKTVSPKDSFKRTTHPEAQWFANAGLGLFLHWGISSVEGKGDLSWSMIKDTPWDAGSKNANKMTPAEYWGQADRFKADRYDPNKWLQAAASAGFRYAVLTTRHHDGYALWPSAHGDFSTRTHLDGRDLVAPYIEACRKNGLKVGLYYSPPDWHRERSYRSFLYHGVKKANPDAPDLGVNHEPIVLPQRTEEEKQKEDREYRAYIRGQVEELLTRYGKIDLLWFDGGPDAISIERIRELQPGIVVNPRMHGYGDFETPEVNFPKAKPAGWWELCALWNEGAWGYLKHERYRPTASVLREFSRVRAWGGNYLINMAPSSHGELSETAYARLEELGDWMRHSGAAVTDTRAGIWPERCNVPCTQKGDKLYLLVPPDFREPVEVKEIGRPTDVRLLRDRQAVPYTVEGGVLRVSLPHAARTTLVDVIEVSLPAVKADRTVADPIAALVARVSPEEIRAHGPLTGLSPDGHELAERFLRPLAEGQGLLPASEVAANVARAAEAGQREAVARLMNNEVQLLGGIPVQHLGDPIDWLRAPGGDWQWPTHLSRHYWLLPVAYAYRATGKEEYARKIVDVLLDWQAKASVGADYLDNTRQAWSRRYADGLPEPVTEEGRFRGYVDGPWTALSAHARVDYWTQLFQLIWDSPAMTNRNVAVLLGSIVGDHRQVMIDFPRQMNQYQGIASSLINIGFAYPGFTDSARAETIGWERLAAHTRREVYPDGSLAEASPNYGIGMMTRLARQIREGERRGRKVPILLRERLARAARYYAATADPMGRSPRIAKGGGDALAAVRDLNALSRDPETAYLATRGKEGTPPSSFSASFPWAGHHAFRSGGDEKATWLFFDAGPRGTGHHDKAQLGVQLFANGEWLLTDPGYYSYSSEGEEGRMARYLHSTAAHNTALVDGHGQLSVPPGKSQSANESPGEYGWSDSGGAVRAEGEYTYGYGPDGKIGVRHRRRVSYDRSADTFTIEDTFTGSGEHRIDLHWQFDPAADVTADNGAIAARRERTTLKMAFSGAPNAKIEVIRGQSEPPLGWFSETYGKLTPAPMARVSMRAELPITVVSHLKVVRL